MDITRERMERPSKKQLGEVLDEHAMLIYEEIMNAHLDLAEKYFKACYSLGFHDSSRVWRSHTVN